MGQFEFFCSFPPRQGPPFCHPRPFPSVIPDPDRGSRVVVFGFFREELLKEGVQYLVSGDMETGKTILRDYINATVGFEELGNLTDKSPKSLMRMFSPKGNPQAKNLFEIIECLQKREGICLEVRAVH